MMPFQTHHMIREACAPLMAGMILAQNSRPLADRFRDHAAKPYVNPSPAIWYFHDTPVDLVFHQETGYILLDHVRKLRSPPFDHINAALAGRVKALKEAEDYEILRRETGDAQLDAPEVPSA